VSGVPGWSAGAAAGTFGSLESSRGSPRRSSDELRGCRCNPRSCTVEAVSSRRGLQKVANYATIVGALGLLSVPSGWWGIYRSRADLIVERRISHGLDLLRAMAKIPGHQSFEHWAAVRAYLLMIPGSADMPMTRVALDANRSDEELAA